MRGTFITLEGVDGAGKSSFLPWIEQRLRASGRDVLMTREPGGTPLGEKLRALLLSEPATPLSEVLLVFAARMEHLTQVIVPAIEAGRCVLCDRFTDATYAYQGGGRGIDLTRIGTLEAWVQAGRQPDLTILFDLPVEIARERSSAVRAPDRFESERLEFFAKVRDGYLRRAAQFPGRFRVIDASRSVAEVEAQLACIEFPT